MAFDAPLSRVDDDVIGHDGLSVNSRVKTPRAPDATRPLVRIVLVPAQNHGRAFPVTTHLTEDFIASITAIHIDRRR